MSYPVFMVPSGDVLPVFFDSFDGGTGASITLTGLAATDVEIYKDGSVTQRASDAGITLLDTDGIDFDGITGIHGFSIDTGDNTDAGFYTVGAWFTVVVSAVTIDAQTVSFVACQFRIMAAESVAAKPKVDVDAWLGTAAATPTVAGVPEVDLTHVAGATTNVAALATNVDAILTDTSTTLDDLIDTEIATIVSELAKVPKSDGTASWNATALAAIQSEANDALVAYDPPTNAEIPTAAAIADAIWDEAQADHVGVGTFGVTASEIADILVDTGTTLQGELDGIQADTEDIQARLPAALVGGRIDATVDATGMEAGAVAAIADGVWDEAATGHTDAGKAGEQLWTDLDAVLVDTSTTLQGELDGIQADTEDIQARIPAALTGDGNIKADMLAVSGDTTAADRLEALMDGTIVAQVNDAGASTTAFIADGFTEATNDHFIGRLITFISGALSGQQTAITDYVGATQTFTVTALTEAPANNDFFVIH
jgi:hypothetical protein